MGADDVQEPACDVLGDDHCRVVVLGISLSLDVPILDGSDDVRFVGFAQLNLDLVPPVRLRILQKQVETPSPGLGPLTILQDEVPETKNRRILTNPVLKPPLVQFGMVLQPDALRLRVLECGHSDLLC